MTIKEILSDVGARVEWVLIMYPIRISDGSTVKLGASTRPARTDIPSLDQPLVLLDDPGVINKDLSGDIDLSGPTTIQSGSSILSNISTDIGTEGPLDAWRQFRFSGRKAELYVVREGDPWTSAAIFRCAPMGEEPVGSPDAVEIPYAAPYGKLSTALDVKKLTGIPVCLESITTTAKATAPNNSVYDVASFTAMVRFRQSTIGANNSDILRRGTVNTTRQFLFRILNSGDANLGKLEVRGSFGGVNTLIGRTASRVDTSSWMMAVLAVRDQNRAYLMVDGEVIAEISLTAVVGNPASAMEFAIGVGLQTQDVRFYSYYMDPDEARASSSVLGDVNDPALKGAWECSDNVGDTATDYSVTANHAALAGTNAVDRRWTPSDLGIRALTGNRQPIAAGYIFNAPLQVMHASSPARLRWDEDASISALTTLRSRGVPLALTTDYTVPGGGMVQLVGSVSDPMTFDTVGIIGKRNLSDIAYHLLVERGRYDASDMHTLDWELLAQLLPFNGSFWTDTEVKGSEVMDKMMSPVGAHWVETDDGMLAPRLLLPPCGPGPYGEVNTMEVLQEGAIIFTDRANVTGSFSLVAWVKPWRIDRVTDAGVEEYLINKLGGTSGYWLSLPSSGFGEAQFGFRVSSVNHTVSTGEGALAWGQWNLVVGVFNTVDNKMTIYAAPAGYIPIASATATGKTVDPVSNSNQINIGIGLKGGIAHVQVWNKALSTVEIQSMMSAPVTSDANLIFYAPLGDGQGLASERVLNDNAAAHGDAAFWRPDAEFDLSLNAAADFELRSIRPAREVIVKYRQNYGPLKAADISASVSVSDRWDLMRPHRSIPIFSNNNRVDNLLSRSVEVNTHLTEARNAKSVGRFLLRRMAAGRQIGTFLDVGRDGLWLDTGRSEFRIVTPRYGMGSGAHFRSVATRKKLSSLTADIGGWR